MRKQKSIITVKQLLYIFLDSGVKLRATYPYYISALKLLRSINFFFLLFIFLRHESR